MRQKDGFAQQCFAGVQMVTAGLRKLDLSYGFSFIFHLTKDSLLTLMSSGHLSGRILLPG